MIAILKKIWFYTKKLFWLLFVVAALIFIAKSMRDKNQKKSNINEKLAELKAIENKTEADKRAIEKLEQEAAGVEDEIVDITKKYENKLKKLHEKPPKDGDASRSYDDMKNNW